MTNEHASPLHPVVDAYVNVREPLLDSLRRQPEPREPLVQAMLDLRESMSEKTRAATALVAARAITPEQLGAADPDLAVLFMCMWGNLCFLQRRLEELQAVLRRAKSLATDKTPPEITSHILDIEALFAGGRGDLARREQLSLECISALERSPRRKIAVWDRVLLLARLGRGAEVEAELKWLESVCDQNFQRSRVAICRYFNSVETGQAREALEVIPEFDGDRLIANFFASDYYQRRFVLELLCRQSELAKAPPSAVPQTAIFDSAQALTCLLQNDAAGALRWARLNYDTLDMALGFHSYNLIRAELAARHGEAARRLLLRRHENGYKHYCDDFFLARVESLAGDRSAAAERFKAFLAAVERYQARGRLDLELRLAIELSPHALIQLAQAALSAAPGMPRTSSRLTGMTRTGVDRLIGKSREMAATREIIRRFAPLPAPILITGETGTGKELVARALHEASPRSAQPFIAVNCGAISESLLESELFGHARGAFTGAFRPHRGFFEEAGTGTLFLDEIGEITPRLQVALLRVLESGDIRPIGASQTHKTSCRIVAATNADLKKLSDDGRFRKDLFFRLSRLRVHLPPLRERTEDILPLADNFLAEGRCDDVRPVMIEALKNMMLRYDWPGNVRELRHSLERMRLVNSDKPSYDAADLDIKPAGKSGAALKAQRSGPGLPAVTLPPATTATAERSQRAPGAMREEDVVNVLAQSRCALRRLERLRELFTRHKTLTRSEVAKIIGVSPATATGDLQLLCREGFVNKVQPSPSPRSHYFTLRSV